MLTLLHRPHSVVDPPILTRPKVEKMLADTHREPIACEQIWQSGGTDLRPRFPPCKTIAQIVHLNTWRLFISVCCRRRVRLNECLKFMRLLDCFLYPFFFVRWSPLKLKLKLNLISVSVSLSVLLSLTHSHSLTHTHTHSQFLHHHHRHRRHHHRHLQSSATSLKA